MSMTIKTRKFGKKVESKVCEMTFRQGLDDFLSVAPEGGWSDYWAMQQDWEFYKDNLCRDRVITQKQADSWSNPCTPETFDKWQKRNGLTRRSGYESKKSESRPSYYDHPLIMAITYKGSTIYCGAEDGDMWSNDIEDAYVWNSFDTISTIAVENFVAVAKEALETRWISEDNVEYLPAPTDTDESKKSEGISDMIDAKIDYNMFMRMCKTAAYLEEDEDYWDALWDFYSEVGSIGDALVFFDNLFQYTAWKDVDETYDELKDEYKDESKTKEECIEKAIDEGALDGVYPYGDHYLWVY